MQSIGNIKKLYFVINLQTVIVLNAMQVNLFPNGSVVSCPVFTNKKEAKKCFPNAELVKIERVE